MVALIGMMCLKASGFKNLETLKTNYLQLGLSNAIEEKNDRQLTSSFMYSAFALLTHYPALHDPYSSAL